MCKFVLEFVWCRYYLQTEYTTGCRVHVWVSSVDKHSDKYGVIYKFGFFSARSSNNFAKGKPKYWLNISIAHTSTVGLALAGVEGGIMQYHDISNSNQICCN